MLRRMLLISLIILSLLLSACGTTESVKIQFESNGGSEIDDRAISRSDSSIQMPEPTREGYDFVGWFIDEELSQPFTLAAILTQTELILYAKWEELTDLVTITFESNGGSIVDVLQNSAGASIDAPIPPTKEGHTFGGWYIDTELVNSYSFETMPEEDITVYAKWTINQYTITYETNGGTTIANINLDFGATIVEPTDPTKQGFIFEGWFSDQDLTTPFVFATMPSSDITIYANWSITQVQITFDSNQGSVVPALFAAPGDTITAPTTPTKEGHTFMGWYSDADFVNEYAFTIMPDQDLILYAKWSVNPYTMTFETDGGTAIVPLTLNFGTIINMTLETVKEGHTFIGWFSDLDRTIPYNFVIMPSTNLTVYAKWEINQVEISFESNGGSVVPSFVANYGIDISAPTEPEKTGYTFVGWYEDQDLSTAYTFTTMPSVDKLLYAKWDINQYTITFETNNDLTVEPIEVAYNELIPTIENLSLEGYQFEGWYLDDAFTTLFDLTNMPNDHVVLYAKWSALSYLVRYFEAEGIRIVDVFVTQQATFIKTSNDEIYGFGNVKMNSELNYTGDADPLNITNQFTLHQDESISMIKGGPNHYLALTSDGRLFTWGLNSYGKLGNGTLNNVYVPQDITEYFSLQQTETIVLIEANYDQSFAVTSLGRVFSWGYNSHGQLGDGTQVARSLPTNTTAAFSFFTGEFVTVISATQTFTMYMTNFGRVFAHGHNANGELGNNKQGFIVLNPTDITAGFVLQQDESLVDIQTAYTHTYVLTSHGRLFGFGLDSVTRFNNNTVTYSLPTDLTSTFDLDEGDGIVGISTGYYDNVVFTASGKVLSWGWNTANVLATNDGLFYQNIRDVTNNVPSDLLTWHFGQRHAVILTLSGQLITFGQNGAGQLGDGTRTDNPLLKPVVFEDFSVLPIYEETVVAFSEFDLYVPEKSGYEFIGWYVDPQFTHLFDAEVMPNNNVDLYAKWAPLQVTLTLQIDDTESQEYTQNIGIPFVKPTDPILVGYTFDGWYLNLENNLVFDFATILEDDTTVYAKWLINEYTISFEANGGSSINAIVQDFKSLIAEPAAPTKLGFAFDGWYLDEDLTSLFTFTTMPAEDTLVYAKWSPALVNYMVEHYNEELSGFYVVSSTTQLQALTGSTVTAIPLQQTGFEIKSDHEDLIMDGLVLADGSLILKIYYARKTLQIDFILTDGAPSLTVTGTFGEEFTAPENPIRIGYSFDGWYLDVERTIVYVFDTMPENDFTLYAKWVGAQGALSLNTMGGNTLDDIIALTGADLIITTPTKQGHTFINWYTDDTYSTVFGPHIMPAGGGMIFAKWEANIYTMTFDSQGGSLVDPIDAAYLAPILAPVNPAKDDFVFAGWYLDVAFEQPFVFITMPGEDFTLYAKWVDATSPTAIIHQISKQASDLVEIQGVVYAILANQYQGYFIFDATGMVFIASDQTGLAIGDEVLLEGTLDFNNSIPWIHTITSTTLIGSDRPTKTPVLIDLQSIENIPQTLSNVYDVYETEGVLYQSENEFYLVDIELGTALLISKASYLDNLFIELSALSSDRVKLTFVLTVENSLNVATLLAIEANPYTSLEKFAIIESLAIDFFDLREVFSGETFIIDETDPYGWTTITHIATGDNAALYDSVNKVFLETDIEKTVTFEITLTIGQETQIFTINVLVKPLIVTSILNVLQGVTGSHYLIDAIVVSTSEYGIMILKDDSGFLYADNPYNLEIGDRILAMVRRDMMDQMVFISAENDGFILHELVSKENELGLTATVLDAATILSYDLTDPTIYGKYVELRGFVMVGDYMDMMSFYNLITNEYQIPIEPFTHTGFEKLMEYEWMEVIIHGFIMVGSDEKFVLFYEGIREDIKIPEYTDLELVNVLETMFNNQYAGYEFVPFETFEWIPYHKVLGASYEWSMDATTEAVYDAENNRFGYVEINTPISFTITITKGVESKTFTLSTILKGLELTDIEFIKSQEMWHDVYVKGLIVYWHPTFAYLLSDGGDLLRLEMQDLSLRAGDYAIVLGSRRVNNNGREISLGTSYSGMNPVVKVLSRDNPITIPITGIEFNDLQYWGTKDPYTYTNYVEITGRLYTLSNGRMRLHYADNDLWIDSSDMYTYYKLEAQSGNMVTLRLFTHEYISNVSRYVFQYTGSEGELVVHDYTEAEKAILIEQYILDAYGGIISGDRAFNFTTAGTLFAEATIIYTPINDIDGIIDITNNFIQAVVESTSIAISVELFIGDFTYTFEFVMTILPVVDDRVDMNQAMIGGYQTFEGTIVSITRISHDYFSLMVEDGTGTIFVLMTYSDYYAWGVYFDGQYVGETMRVHGLVSDALGRMDVLPVSFSFSNKSGSIQKEFIQMSLEDVAALDPMNPSVYGMAVQISGTVVRDSNWFNSTKVYLTDGTHRVDISLIEPNYGLLSPYIGLRVVLKGFIYGENALFGIQGISLMAHNYSYDMTPVLTVGEYTDVEAVDFAMDRLLSNVNQYNRVYLPGDYVSLTTSAGYIDPQNQITYSYSFLSGGEYVEQMGSQLILLQAPTNQEIIIEVTIQKNDAIRTETYSIYLNGYTFGTLEDLFNDIPGTFEIALDALFLGGEFGFYYFVIEGKVYYIETFAYGWFSEGQKVTILGKKNVIDGVANYTYDIRFLETWDFEDITISKTIATIESLYTNDYLVNPIQQGKVELYGRVDFDSYMGMYTLEDNGFKVYIRSPIYGSMESSPLFDFMDDYLHVSVLLPVRMVRDEYYIVDFNSNINDLRTPTLTVEEQISIILDKIRYKVDDVNILAGDPLNFIPTFDPIHGGTITYSLVNEADAAFIDLGTYRSGNVSVPTTIQILVEVEKLSETVSEVMEITILPRIRTTIKDVIWELIPNRYLVEGTVISIGKNSNEELQWLILQDDTDTIYVNLLQIEGSLFHADLLSIAVGDVITLIGETFSYEANRIQPILEWVRFVEVTNFAILDEPLPILRNIADLLELNYLDLDVALEFVEITGQIIFTGSYSYPSFALIQDGYDMNYYKLELLNASIVDYYTVFNGLVGETVTIKGYIIGLNNLQNKFAWYMTIESYELVVIPE